MEQAKFFSCHKELHVAAPSRHLTIAAHKKSTRTRDRQKRVQKKKK